MKEPTKFKKSNINILMHSYELLLIKDYGLRCSLDSPTSQIDFKH